MSIYLKLIIKSSDKEQVQYKIIIQSMITNNPMSIHINALHPEQGNNSKKKVHDAKNQHEQ